jgi:hypothetical protein
VSDIERLDAGIVDPGDPKPAKGRALVVGQMGERAAFGRSDEPDGPGHVSDRTGFRSSVRIRDGIDLRPCVEHGVLLHASPSGNRSRGKGDGG